MTERYANFFKSSMAFAIFLVPFFLLGWIFGERVVLVVFRYPSTSTQGLSISKRGTLDGFRKGSMSN